MHPDTQDNPAPQWPPPLHLPYAPLDGAPAVAKLTVYVTEAGQVCRFAIDRLGDDTAASARAAFHIGITSVARAKEAARD